MRNPEKDSKKTKYYRNNQSDLKCGYLCHFVINLKIKGLALVCAWLLYNPEFLSGINRSFYDFHLPEWLYLILTAWWHAVLHSLSKG